MISWIQNHLIRHGRWIFLTLLAVIIVAFVFTIGNTPGCTTNQSGYEAQYFYSYDLNSKHEMEDLGQKVYLSAILKTGRPPLSQQQVQSQLLSRIALLHLADELRIPAPSENSLASYIQSQAAFRGPDGQFSRDAYTRFIDNIESDPSIRQDLIVLVPEEDYRIAEIEAAITGPGYFLPSEALSQVQLNETTLEVTTAQINFSEFNPEITPSNDVLTQFYTDNIKRYEIPERIEAYYIKFPSEKYISSVDTFTEAELREYFTSNRARFVAAYKATLPEMNNAEAETSSPPSITFKDVRSDVTKELGIKTSEKITNQAAQDFVLKLYRNNIQLDTPEFQELLDENDLKMIEIQPYTAEETLTRSLPQEMLESAYALNKNRYFSDAYKIEGGYGVLIFSKRLPPEIPAYEAVAETVRTDYSAEEKRRLFNEEGQRLKNELSALLEAGVEFAKAAEALGLEINKNEAFKIGEAPRTINPAALQRAKNMEAGTLSPMITSGESGLFVYVNSKTVPEIEADDEQVTQAKNFLQRYSSFVSSNALLNELITEGLPPEDLSE